MEHHLIPLSVRCLSQRQTWTEAELCTRATPPSVTAALTTSCASGRRSCWGRKIVRCLSKPTPESMVCNIASLYALSVPYWSKNSKHLSARVCVCLSCRGHRWAGGIWKQRSRFDSLLHRALPGGRGAAWGRPVGDGQKGRPLLVLLMDELQHRLPQPLIIQADWFLAIGDFMKGKL